MRSHFFDARVLLLAAISSTAAACAIGFPAGRQKVTDVYVTGLGDAVDEDDIADGLANHPPRGLVFRTYAPYDELSLEVDRRRITSYLERRGFFSSSVSEAEVTTEDGEVTVRFVVDRGPPSKVENLTLVVTSSVVDKRRARRRSRIVVGERFDFGAYETTKALLSNWLKKIGRPRGSVVGRVEVDRDRNVVEIFFTIEPGPLVRFDRVTIEPSALPKSAIEHRIAWASGDVFDPDKVETTEGRLYALDLVGSVRFVPTFHSNDERLNMSIAVSEPSRNELRLGGGFEIDPSGYGISGRAGYTRRNFFDPLTSLRLELRPRLTLFSNDRAIGVKVTASADVVRDDFLYPRAQLQAGVAYRLVTFEAFTTQGPSLRVSVGRPFFDDRLRTSIGVAAALYTVSRNDVLEAQPNVETLATVHGVDNPLPLLFATPSVTYDGRDNPLSPHRGFLVSLPMEIGKLFREDGAFYAKVTPDAQGYLPIFTPRVVLAGRVRVGANILKKPLPITQRYFTGGSDSQRGFGRRRLAPGFGSQGRYYPLGAEAIFLANAELRFEIFRLLGEWFGAVVFTDVGDAANDFGDLRFDNPHVAIGAGLRYHTPVGPLRFDLGFRVNRFGDGEPDPISDTVLNRIAPHITIGEAF